MEPKCFRKMRFFRRRSEVIRTIRGSFSFVLVHAGNLGFYGAWNTLVAAARSLAKEGVRAGVRR